MKEVTVFEAEDGKRFDTERECRKYETVLRDLTGVFKPLASRTGGKALKHNIDVVRKAYGDFYTLCSYTLPSWQAVFVETAMNRRHPSLAERVLSDFSHDYPCLYEAAFRLKCISRESGIEYEQPYYVAHEDEWKGPVEDMSNFEPFYND